MLPGTSNRKKQRERIGDGDAPRIIMLTGVTHANRHQVTADINDAVVASGGWVSDHTFFSNIATNFRLVLEPQGLATFPGLVIKAGVHLDQESDTKLPDLIAQKKACRKNSRKPECHLHSR